MKFRKLASVFLVSALFITGCTNNSSQSEKESDTAVKGAQV